MKYVPRREKNRRAFNSPEGLELLEKVTYAAKKYNDTKTLWRESLTPEETGPLRESTPSVTVKSPKEKDEKNGN